MKLLRLFFCSVIIASTFSCELLEEDDIVPSASACNPSNGDQLAKAVSDAGVRYAGNQTSTNCRSYKTAMQNFINAYKNCPSVQGQITQLQNLQKELDC